MMYVFFCLLNIVIMTNIFFQALARYQAFVSRITDSLAKPGVKKHLGAAYKPLFEANLSAFEVSSIPQPSPNKKKHPQTDHNPNSRRPARNSSKPSETNSTKKRSTASPRTPGTCPRTTATRRSSRPKVSPIPPSPQPI
jgi:hypothetical protein